MTNKDKQKDSLKKSFITPKQSSADKEADLEALLNRSTTAVAPTLSRSTEVENDDDTNSVEKHRVTLDLSKQLARKVKVEASQRDQTLKAFIVSLINQYFDEKEKKTAR
jgi:hypothetical protein